MKENFKFPYIVNSTDTEGEENIDPRGKGKKDKRAGTAAASKSAQKKTPMLDAFGIDFTQQALEDELDPVVGRKKEIKRISQILGRRKKNNVVLLGDPGVGKSTIVEGLAQRIILNEVSRNLMNKRIVAIDIAGMVAGTKYRGQFEERMKALMKELKENPDVIIFIDELHTVVGAGNSSGSLDASNIFKPALANGDIQCIGATTLDEYREHIESDGALTRRFQPITIAESTPAETLEILQNVKHKYEDYHKVNYTPEAVASTVTLAGRYLTSKFFPDKAFDVLDEAGSKVRNDNVDMPETIVELEAQIQEIKIEKTKVVKSQKYEQAAKLRDDEKVLNDKLKIERDAWEQELENNRETVSEDDIAEVVSVMTGIPLTKVGKNDMVKLKNMETLLKDHVVGQDQAIEKIVKAIQRSRVGLKRKNRPLAKFLYIGGTGTGKTLLTKKIAECLFDDMDALIRFDMSEYQEKFNSSKLLGAPPGYVGYEKGGELTEKVRRKPYSVVLLDEIEKAHPDIFNLLLQVLDDGVLTDGLGRKVDFTNTVIIMTSNLGVKKLQDFGTGVGFAPTNKTERLEEEKKEMLKDEVKKHLSPEFLNRLDEIVVFNSLKKDDFNRVLDINMKDVYLRVNELGYNLELDDEAKKFLIDEGFDEVYGARPLTRVIEKYVEDLISEEIINESLQTGQNIVLTKKDDEENLSIKLDEQEQKAE